MRTWAIAMAVAFCASAVAAENGCVKGIVRDQDGVPLSAVRLVLAGNQTDTEADGTYRITVPAGSHKIHVFKLAGFQLKDGHYLEHKDRRSFYDEDLPPIIVPAGKDCVELNPQLVQTAKLVLQGSDAVTGKKFPRLYPNGQLKVRWGRSLDSRTEKRVKAGDEVVVPSASELYVQIGRDGYQATEFTVPALQPAETRQYDFALPPVVPGCLTGSISNDQAQPVADAAIKLKPTDSLADTQVLGHSAKDGTFEIRGIDPGVYHVAGSKNIEGYTWEWQDNPEVTITSSSQCGRVQISVGPKTAYLTVHVLNAKTLEPMQAGVVLRDSRTGRRESYIQEVKREFPFPVPSESEIILQLSFWGGKPIGSVTIPPEPAGQFREITVTFDPATGVRVK